MIGHIVGNTRIYPESTSRSQRMAALWKLNSLTLKLMATSSDLYSPGERGIFTKIANEKDGKANNNNSEAKKIAQQLNWSKHQLTGAVGQLKNQLNSFTKLPVKVKIQGEPFRYRLKLALMHVEAALVDLQQLQDTIRVTPPRQRKTQSNDYRY